MPEADFDAHVLLARGRAIATGSVFVPCTRCRRPALWFVAGRDDEASRAGEPPLCDACAPTEQPPQRS